MVRVDGARKLSSTDNGRDNCDMKRSATVLLQVVIVLIGIGVLAAMLWQPTLEGRNAHATLFQIYFNDPFLACVYAGSIPFFVGLYQAFKLSGYAGEGKLFSPAAVKALRTIKYCALITAAAIVAVDTYLMIAAHLHPQLADKDGPEGAVMLGMIATLASILIATAAARFERVLQNAVDTKSANDLTV
jgi:hypothetical protein